ncbi:MAG: hypothetical protein HY718_19840 [Planctomycetes bacterium]|nr:hypothetical protein [Planctomycetota bacterium]
MRTIVFGMALLVGVSAANGAWLVNGDFSTSDETGWNRWRAPWGATENWSVADTDGANGPEGELYGAGGNGSFGWYQGVAMPVGMVATVSADWRGDIGGAGWAELMLWSQPAPGGEGNRADVGNAADIAYKKDSWGMNPPTAWGWQPAALSPHPSGNGGTVVSQGWVVVGTKLGGFPMGWVQYDNITLTPEPASILLLALPLLFVRRRRA